MNAAHTHELGIHTRPLAGLALAYITATRLPYLLILFARLRIARAVDAIIRWPQLVYLPITIVVQTIANLRRWTLAPFANDLSVRTTLAHSRLALTLVPIPRVHHIVVRHPTRRAYRYAVVYLAIAIIILAVAYLGHRPHRPHTLDLAVDALLDTLLALTNVAATSHRRQSFIHRTIAVVVHTIADFSVRSLPSRTYPTSPHTRQRP
jgi:hypothetical protein